MHHDSNFSINVDHFKKGKKFMSEIEHLEVIVNALNSEADNLISRMDIIEHKLEMMNLN